VFTGPPVEERDAVAVLVVHVDVETVGDFSAFENIG